MKRIIYYYQTLCGLDDILNIEDTVVTHIHLSSIHFGLNSNKSPYINLNDSPPDSPCFNSMWTDIAKAKKKGIAVVLMVGGAGGAFTDLFNNFDVYYELLKKTIEDHPDISGIDLDVEEPATLDNIKMLINKIRTDFGDTFSISMAPVSYALKYDGSGMGGFCYKELFNSAEGKYIDYFNGQFYGDFTAESYNAVIANGYPAEKIVMGMVSGDFNTRETYQNALDQVAEISKNTDMGGVFVWEYFDCPPDKENHLKWAEDMHIALNIKLFKQCIIL